MKKNEMCMFYFWRQFFVAFYVKEEHSPETLKEVNFVALPMNVYGSKSAALEIIYSDSLLFQGWGRGKPERIWT